MDNIENLIKKQQDALRRHREDTGDRRRKAWEEYKKITTELYRLRHGENP